MSLRLSIVIPCYNCADTLREAVESCYTQGLEITEFEIIMVDDESQDNTRQVMASLATLYPNIRLLFHETNRGGGAARNTAAEVSRADTILCLDSDDILGQMSLKKMLSFLLKFNCDAVTFSTSTNFIGTDTNKISHVVRMKNPGLPILFEDLLQTPEAMCGLYQVFMMKKSAFKKAGGYPTHHHFDTQGFAWRFLAKGLTAYTCPDTNYLQRVRFKESYFLREYNSGRNNYNWQSIFIENFHFFSDETQEFIKNYDCRDLSKNIYIDLLQQKVIFRKNYMDLIGTKNLPQINFINDSKPIPRDSLLGYYIRFNNRLQKFLNF